MCCLIDFFYGLIFRTPQMHTKHVRVCKRRKNNTYYSNENMFFRYALDHIDEKLIITVF